MINPICSPAHSLICSRHSLLLPQNKEDRVGNPKLGSLSWCPRMMSRCSDISDTKTCCKLRGLHLRSTPGPLFLQSQRGIFGMKPPQHSLRNHILSPLFAATSGTDAQCHYTCLRMQHNPQFPPETARLFSLRTHILTSPM